MDKIYSRKRIKIPKINCRAKAKKTNKSQRLIQMLLLFFILIIGCFIYTSYPIFEASCKTAAGSKAVHIMNEEIQKIMSDYNYNNLIDIEKDSSGNIVLMKYNTVLINEITAKIANQIQMSIDNTPRIMVYINFGSVSRSEYFEKFRTAI